MLREFPLSLKILILFIEAFCFMCAVLISWLLWRIVYRLYHRSHAVMKYVGYLRSHGKYTIFYESDKDVFEDAVAVEFVNIAQRGYIDPWLEQYLERIDEHHLPIRVLLNWTRSLAEDLRTSAVPVSRLQTWYHYFHSKGYQADCANNSDYIEFSDYELAFLFGAVHFWLTKTGCCLQLCEYMDHVVCPKLYLLPYFDYFQDFDMSSEQNPEDSISPSPVALASGAAGVNPINIKIENQYGPAVGNVTNQEIDTKSDNQ